MFVPDALEHFLDLQESLVQGPLGVEVLFLDELLGLQEQHPVPENKQVQLQDMGMLL